MLVKHFAWKLPSWTRLAWAYCVYIAIGLGSQMAALPRAVELGVGLLAIVAGVVVGGLHWTEENVPTIRERFAAWRAEGKRLKREWDELG